MKQIGKLRVENGRLVGDFLVEDNKEFDALKDGTLRVGVSCLTDHVKPVEKDK